MFLKPYMFLNKLSHIFFFQRETNNSTKDRHYGLLFLDRPKETNVINSRDLMTGCQTLRKNMNLLFIYSLF